MKSDTSKHETFIKAQKILRRRRLFYIHLVGYLIVVALILFNFYILEDGPYKDPITALNLSVLGAWTVFILIHGIDVYRRRSLLKKTWEDKKVEALIEKESETETRMWE